MSETPTKSQNSSQENIDDAAAAAARRITRNRVIASGAAVGAGVALYAGLVAGVPELKNAAEAQPEKDPVISSEVMNTLVQDSYAEGQYVGSFEIASGSAVIDQAEAAISSAVGEEVWKEARAQKYNYLLDSAKAVNQLFPQPGTTTYVVELDLDHNPDNGNEYIVTLGSPKASEGTIPSPEQRSSNSPDVSNGVASDTALLEENSLAPTPNDP